MAVEQINRNESSSRFRKFLNELLLYSGQYALFYIVMNFSKDGISYFNDTGHTALLFVLAVQTLFLVYFGHVAIFRFLGSLIAPLFYTIVEYELDFVFVFNTGHMFFWFFSIPIGIIQAVQIKTENVRIKKVNEYLITFLNVLIFMFIYFYFDLKIGLGEQLANNEISPELYAQKLTVLFLGEGISVFVTDPAHIYIIIGGVLLAFSLAIGRIRILELTEEIKRLFGRYIDKNVRDKILRDGGGVSEKIKACVLFSDIRNFTQISEMYKPEQITEMLNLYFTEWAILAQQFNGTIDKYIGDAVMIIFRSESGNPSEEAVSCAISMLSRMPHIKEMLVKKGLPAVQQIGIGLHYGTVIAGDIGSQNRVDYTFIGDSVNTASRLEGYSKEIESDLVISRDVYTNLSLDLQNQFVEKSKEIFLKGKEYPVKIFAYKNG